MKEGEKELREKIAEEAIKEALALLAGSTNKRDKQIMKLLRSALKDLY